MRTLNKMMPFDVGGLPGGRSFARWLGYMGNRRYVALYFVPDGGFPQLVACEDGVEAFYLGEDQKDYFIAIIQAHLMRRNIDVGYVTPSKYWVILDTQSNALYAVEKGMASEWIERE